MKHKVVLTRGSGPMSHSYLLELNGKVIVDCADTDPIAAKYLTIKAAENLAKVLNVPLEKK